MLAITSVPRQVLDWQAFLAAGTPEEEPATRPLLPTLRAARGTERGTYSTYTSGFAEETPGSITAVCDLLVKEAPARLPPAPTTAGRVSWGIGSTKFCPNSYEKIRQQDKED